MLANRASVGTKNQRNDGIMLTSCEKRAAGLPSHCRPEMSVVFRKQSYRMAYSLRRPLE
jgi:hypothetical protein